MAVSKSCLQRIILLSKIRHGSPSIFLKPEIISVFLAGFVIANRPTQLLDGMSTLEQALHGSAKPLLTVFEKICAHIQSSPARSFQEVPHELTKDFLTVLFEYLKRFAAWKRERYCDPRVACRIKHALYALYIAEQHLPPDEPEDSKLKIELRTRIERLRYKLQQICGVDALNEIDEQRRVCQSLVQLLSKVQQIAVVDSWILFDKQRRVYRRSGSGGPGSERSRSWPEPSSVRLSRALEKISGFASTEAIDLEFIKRRAEGGLGAIRKNLIASIVAISSIVRELGIRLGVVEAPLECVAPAHRLWFISPNISTVDPLFLPMISTVDPWMNIGGSGHCSCHSSWFWSAVGSKGGFFDGSHVGSSKSGEYTCGSEFGFQWKRGRKRLSLSRGSDNGEDDDGDDERNCGRSSRLKSSNDSGQICIVCLQPLSGRWIVDCPTCSIPLHRACIDLWGRYCPRESTCPHCRGPWPRPGLAVADTNGIWRPTEQFLPLAVVVRPTRVNGA